MTFYTSYNADNNKTTEEIKNFIDSKNISFISTRIKNNYHELGDYDDVQIHADVMSDDDYIYDSEDPEDIHLCVLNDNKIDELRQLEKDIQVFIYKS